MLAELLLLCAPAWAWEAADDSWRWQSAPLDHPLWLDTSSFPATLGTEAEIEDAFVDGLDEWNDAGADLHLVYGGRTVGWTGGDGTLVAYHDPGAALDYTIATATRWAMAGGITTDCDIAFWASNGAGPIDWTLDPPGWGEADLVETATHEVGHCIGLNHSAVVGSVMWPSVRGTRGLHADDLAGVQAVYGAACADLDGDGYDDCRGDCDDTNALVHPGAVEVCDGIDGDCDGIVDNTGDVTATFGDTSNYQFLTKTAWGAAYEVGADRSLHRFAQHLELLDDARLAWTVSELDAATGTWTRLVTHTELATKGTGWFESPPVDLLLQAGRTYLLMVGVEGEARFHYDWGPLTSAEDLTAKGALFGSWVPVDGLTGTLDTSAVLHQEVQLGRLADADGDGLLALCGDCDDGAAGIAPGAPEVCDGVDNDCDGAVDEDSPGDGDGDGILDCLDGCPADAANDLDGDGVCGDVDLCPADADPDQLDSDGDGLGDACDPTPLPPQPDPGDSGSGDSGDSGCSCGDLQSPYALPFGLALFGLGWRRRR